MTIPPFYSNVRVYQGNNGEDYFVKLQGQPFAHLPSYTAAFDLCDAINLAIAQFAESLTEHILMALRSGVPPEAQEMAKAARAFDDVALRVLADWVEERGADPTAERLRKMVFEDGDLLILHVPGPLKSESRAALRQQFQDHLQNLGRQNPVIVLDNGMTLERIVLNPPSGDPK